MAPSPYFLCILWCFLQTSCWLAQLTTIATSLDLIDSESDDDDEIMAAAVRCHLTAVEVTMLSFMIPGLVCGARELMERLPRAERSCWSVR
jgi:hypothetical protein